MIDYEHGGDIAITPDLKDAFVQLLKEKKVELNFTYGHWGGLAREIETEQAEEQGGERGYELVLTAETIYSEASVESLIQVLRVANGTAADEAGANGKEGKVQVGLEDSMENLGVQDAQQGKDGKLALNDGERVILVAAKVRSYSTPSISHPHERLGGRSTAKRRRSPEPGSCTGPLLWRRWWPARFHPPNRGFAGLGSKRKRVGQGRGPECGPHRLVMHTAHFQFYDRTAYPVQCPTSQPPPQQKSHRTQSSCKAEIQPPRSLVLCSRQIMILFIVRHGIPLPLAMRIDRLVKVVCRRVQCQSDDGNDQENSIALAISWRVTALVDVGPDQCAPLSSHVV